MEYEAAVSWLLGLTNYETSRSAPNPGAGPGSSRVWNLDRVEKLLSALGNPQRGRPTVHVAGTKGKGSTSALIAAALTASGKSTGLFTSPHLHTICERLRVDGINASQREFASAADLVCSRVDEVDEAGDSDSITTFEALTAMAFVHFAARNVDAQVVEVGLGGRLDATNVLHPSVSVITSLSMDHEAYLGDTLEKIAAEKAGIIKPGVPVVSALQEPTALNVIEARAREVDAPLTLLGRDIAFRRESATHRDQVVRVWGTVAGLDIDHTVALKLLGRHQLENAALSVVALRLVGGSKDLVDRDAIDRGFSTVDWPGRLEVLAGDPTVIVDGAHNQYSAMRLVEAIEEDFPGRAVHLVFGTSIDKNPEAIIGELAHGAASMFSVVSRHPRAANMDALSDAAWASGLPVRPAGTVANAIEMASEEARKDGGVVLVTGSLFVVAEAREAILGIEPEVIPAANPDTVATSGAI
jgi:dihydrofolate synthase/folylpolyglutamate synthase